LVKPWELNTQERNSSRRAKYRLKSWKRSNGRRTCNY